MITQQVKGHDNYIHYKVHLLMITFLQVDKEQETISQQSHVQYSKRRYLYLHHLPNDIIY